MEGAKKISCCREVIRKNFVALYEQIPVAPVVIYLYQEGAISCEAMERILNVHSGPPAYKLLIHIPFIGPEGMNRFQRALRYVGSGELADMLTRTEIQEESNRGKGLFNLSESTKVTITRNKQVMISISSRDLLLSKEEWAIVYMYLPSTVYNMSKKTFDHTIQESHSKKEVILQTTPDRMYVIVREGSEVRYIHLSEEELYNLNRVRSDILDMINQKVTHLTTEQCDA